MTGKTTSANKINTLFKLVSSIKVSIQQGALNTAMADLVKAKELYLKTPGLLKGEKEVLEEDFYNLLMKVSSHPEFAQTYGPVTFRRGEHQMNIDFMKQLIEFGAESIQEKIEKGIEMLQKDRLEEAKMFFQEVLDNPDAAIDHFLSIGDAYLRKKIWKTAQEVFAKAIEKDPNSIHILNRMAISLRKDGKFNEAVEIYRKAIMLSPQDEGLYYNAARLFLEMGRPLASEKALNKALAINPSFEQASKLLMSMRKIRHSKVAKQDNPA